MSEVINKSSYEFSITRLDDELTIEEYQVLITNGLEITEYGCLEISELGTLEII